MSWKHWTAVVLVIGVGIVLQIAGHDTSMEEHRHTADTSAPAPATDPSAGPYRTISLEVTGMT